MKTAPFLLSLLVLVFGVACSGDKPAGSASPSPSSEQTQESRHPLPTLSVERLPLSWTATESLFDVSAAREVSLAGAGAAFRQVRWSAVGETAVRVVEIGSPVAALEWNTTGIGVSVLSRREIYSPLLRSHVELDWNATVLIDPVTSAMTRQFDSVPPGNGMPSIGFPLAVNTATGQLLLSRPAEPPGVQRPYDIYLQSRDGITRKLELAIGSSQPGQLSPDGRYVVFTGDHRVTPYDETAAGARLITTWDTYFMPVTGDEVLKLPGVVGTAMQGPVDRLGVSADPRIVMLVTDTDSPLDGILAVFDTASGSFRVVAPVQLSNTTYLSWNEGELVRVGNAEGMDLDIDLRTGAATPRSLVSRFVEIPSPSGTRIARLEHPDPAVPAPPGLDCIGQPVRFEVLEQATGGVSVLAECAGGFISGATWVGDRRVVLQVGEARGGRGGPPSLVSRLYDLDTGEVIELTTLPERYARVFAKDDGSQFALSGDRLRIFSADGLILADHGPLPVGYWVSILTWSPDGSSIAYALEPIM